MCKENNIKRKMLITIPLIPGCCWSVVVVVMFDVACIGVETWLVVTYELELKPVPVTPPWVIKLKSEETFKFTGNLIGFLIYWNAKLKLVYIAVSGA